MSLMEEEMALQAKLADIRKERSKLQQRSSDVNTLMEDAVQLTAVLSSHVKEMKSSEDYQQPIIACQAVWEKVEELKDALLAVTLFVPLPPSKCALVQYCLRTSLLCVCACACVCVCVCVCL